MNLFRDRVIAAFQEIEGLEAELSWNRRQAHEIKVRLRGAKQGYRKLMEEEAHPERRPLLQGLDPDEEERDGTPVPIPPGQPPGTVGHSAGATAIADEPIEVDPDAWRNETFEDLKAAGQITQGACDVLWELEFETVGSLVDYLTDGGRLHDLRDAEDLEPVLEGLWMLRRAKGWAEDQGIPAAWLEVPEEAVKPFKLYECVFREKLLPPLVIEAPGLRSALDFAHAIHPAGTRFEVIEAQDQSQRHTAKVWPSDFDHIAEEEKRYAGHRESYYVKAREQIAAWRERQAAGDLKPDWRVLCVFDVALDDGLPVRVKHKPGDVPGHSRRLEFHGPVSETGYRSHHVIVGEVKKSETLLDFARRKAREFHGELVEENAKKLKKAKARPVVDTVTGEEVKPSRPKRSRKAKPAGASA